MAFGRSLANDLIAYGEAEGVFDIEVVRIAILPHQITDDVPSAPPKGQR
jgi:hypothetical protein